MTSTLGPLENFSDGPNFIVVKSPQLWYYIYLNLKKERI